MIRWWRPVAFLAAVSAGLSALPAQGQVELSRALSRLAPMVGTPSHYSPKAKESTYRIARRFGVSTTALSNANAGASRAGLLVPTQHVAPLATKDGLVVNLTERNVYVYRKGVPTDVFPIAIGRLGWETPTGSYHVANKRKNPTWFPPKWAKLEDPVPPGPKNPLGDRWMGLSVPGYGLHATNRPSSVGRVASHGCMRMYPEHARQLFGLVQVGTPVQIVYQLFSLGYQPQDGIVYLAHYADPYRRGDTTVAAVQKALKSYGLDQMVDEDSIKALLARANGVPMPLVGSRVKVLVDGQPVHFALSPTRVGEEWMVPAGPLAQALGARLELGPDTSYVGFARGSDRLLLTPGKQEALVNGALHTLNTPPRVVAGYPLVPLKETVAALGGSIGWDDAQNAIVVASGVSPEPLVPAPVEGFQSGPPLTSAAPAGGRG
jgi:L,D-transpeptidase ErfK/SrfK